MLRPLSHPQHETKLPASNYIILVDQNLSNSNKKVIQETLVCESRLCLTLCCQGDSTGWRCQIWEEGTSWETGFNADCRKTQLWERPAQNRGVLMQTGNHCSSWYKNRLETSLLTHQPPLLPGVVSSSSQAASHCLTKGNIPARFFSGMSWIWERSSLYPPIRWSNGPAPSPPNPQDGLSEVMRPRRSSHRPLLLPF